MRPSEILSTRLHGLGIAASQLADIRIRADEAGFGDPRRLTVDLVITFFGVPARAYPDRLLYDLAIWPQHYFEWQLEDWGGASHEGFVIRDPPRLPDWVPLDFATLENTFVPWYHTYHEVRRLLGEPELDLSWGHVGEWYFGPLATGHDLMFGFDYGLLQLLRTELGVIEKHRRL